MPKIESSYACKGTMDALNIEKVDCAKLQEIFLSFPRSLYHGNPFWVPPTEERELVGFASHPFYNQAESQAFLASRNGEPCGRIAAIINHAHNEWHGVQHGFFGFFESIDDQEVANALLDSAVQWLSQKKCSLVRGPLNPAVSYQGGLLVEQFDRMPAFLIPYNPSYYVDLIERYGFQTAQNILSFTGNARMLEDINPKIEATAMMAIERFGVTMRQFDMARLEEEVAMYYDIYNRSLKDMWGFTPVTESEIRHAGQTWHKMIVPEFTSIAEIDGEPVAAALGLLDFNPLIKEADGDFNLAVSSGISSINRLEIPCTLVLPQYNLWGLGPAVLNNMLDNGLKWGMEEIEFTWIAESNRLSALTLEHGGARPGQVHRIYELSIDGA